MAVTDNGLHIRLTVSVDDIKLEEIAKLNKLEAELYDELQSDKLTTAQRVSVLSEVRKVVWLRSVFSGAIVLTEHES